MMKGSKNFELAIKTHLDLRSERDPLFAKKYAKPEKSLEDCVTYILNSVKKSGIHGFTDDEVYSMAVHYYTEDNVDPGKPIQGTVVVNHKVELTEEEINKIREKAKEEAYEKEIQRRTKPTSSISKKISDQPTLF